MAYARQSVIVLILFGLAACGGSSDGAGDTFVELPTEETATYVVTFATSWSAGSFPTNFPSGRHFSGLIGATHNEQVTFWDQGQLATLGIESMAETGSKSAFESEIDSAIANGSAESVVSGGGISSSDDQVSLEFLMDKDYPLVTLVSMVAPSPDWFVGVHGIRLFEQGSWVDNLSVDLAVYDAGTDNGLTFNSPNADAVPEDVIALLSSLVQDTDFSEGVHRDNGMFIGTFTFSRTQ